MRIVHVTPFYHPITGGVEEVTTRLSEHMVRRGVEVDVVTYNRLRDCGYGSLPRSEMINGVRVHRLRPNFAFSYGTYSAELSGALRRLNPDVVHVHVWRHPHVFQVARLKKELGFKAILHGHAPFHRISQLDARVWLYHRLVDAFNGDVLTAYDKIVALTPYEGSIYASMFKQDGNRVVIAPNGVDDKMLTYRSSTDEQESNVLLYVGRMCKEKNLPLLVRALKHVTSEVRDIKLILAGQDGGYVGGVMSLAKETGLRKHVLHAGQTGGLRKYELYVSSRLFVNPCVYEAFGMSLLEAQAFGKPCVITGFGGQIYAAPPGFTSILTKPEPRKYAEGILELLKDKDLYARLSSNAMRWARRFAWSKILKLYERLYNGF